jgi:hypothetical protein
MIQAALREAEDSRVMAATTILQGSMEERLQTTAATLLLMELKVEHGPAY